jgi:hypothetical protein
MLCQIEWCLFKLEGCHFWFEMCLFLLAERLDEPVWGVSSPSRSQNAQEVRLLDLESSPLQQDERRNEKERRRFFDVLPPFEPEKPQDEEEMRLGEEEQTHFQLEVSTDEIEMCLFELAETLFPLELRLFELSRSTDESLEPPGIRRPSPDFRILQDGFSSALRGAL